MLNSKFIIVAVLENLIKLDCFGRIDGSKKPTVESLVEVVRWRLNLCEDEILQGLFKMHANSLLQIDLDNQGKPKTVCLLPQGIDLYRQLEVI